MKLRKLGSAIAVSALLMAFLAAFSAPAHAQSISQGFVATGNAMSALSVNIPVAPLHGDALVVFESTGAPGCSYILPPTDSQSQTWGAVGNCQPDTLIGEMQAFAVASYSSSQPDTVNCNFGANAQPEACYVFDVASPGAITLLGTAKGYSTTIQLPGNAATAAPNSLVIAMSEQQPICQPVSPGAGFSLVNPSSACFGGSDGMSGEYIQVGSGGLSSNFPMVVSQSTAWAELVVQVAPPAAVTTTTAFTATVTGWLAPDSAHFANTYILIILPLAGMVFMLMPFMMFEKNPKNIGDRAIYPALLGFTAGAALADVGVSGTTNNQVPFAFVAVGVLLLVLWWWNS